MAKFDDDDKDYRKDLGGDDDDAMVDDAPIDPDDMRSTLTKVLTYRHLRERVRRKSNSTLFFGLFMVGIWWFTAGRHNDWGPFSIIYLSIAMLEVSVGILNRLFPSLEGILIDGFVIMAFGVSSLIRQYLLFQMWGKPAISPVFALLGLYWVYQGIMTMRSYFQLKKALPITPTAEHLRWFDLLERELQRADPRNDPQMLALPMEPPLSVKLIGELCFIMEAGQNVYILGQDQFMIEPFEENPNKALVYLMSAPVAEIKLSESNWNNYTAWRRSLGQPIPDRIPTVRPVDRSQES